MRQRAFVCRRRGFQAPVVWLSDAGSAAFSACVVSGDGGAASNASTVAGKP